MGMADLVFVEECGQSRALVPGLPESSSCSSHSTQICCAVEACSTQPKLSTFEARWTKGGNSSTYTPTPSLCP